MFKSQFKFSRYHANTAFYRYKNIKKKIFEEFKFDLTDKKILDIGCGQRYQYTYLFSKNNNVVGIDLDVILVKHDVRTCISIISKNGINRFLKTLFRALFLDRTYYKELERVAKTKKPREIKVFQMNAEEIKFHDNTFDFVLSILSFEHFKNVDKCVAEIKRVLKKGGKFYISIDLFSKMRGGHEINPSRPWNHLLDKNFKSDVFLNKLRLDDYKKIFLSHFQNVKFICSENPIARQLLTTEIKQELSDYTEMELVMNPLIVIGEK
ncbi:MAG: class I SAM-dependent methyltransferase [Candidatus Lokiarchaeota archaeon]|nr:class I SAM-dependent methyltransferase [Candidatus Lokiarchaeota archaeon]